jgi:hypothetical protein
MECDLVREYVRLMDGSLTSMDCLVEKFRKRMKG